MIGRPGTKVKARLLLGGVRQTDLARKLGCSRATICNTLAGRQRSERTRRAIVRAFCRLARRRVSYELFWRPLIEAEEEAA